jgi:glucosyl-dolichyl phosphate glucuronosyltransferase
LSHSGPKVSVILPTRNRAHLLSRTLESLAVQSPGAPQFQVIVVDNGSSDGTRVVADVFRSRLRDVVYLYVAEPGLHAARHAGMRQAASEILLFGDDDIRAAPTWVEAVWRAFTDPTVGLVGGKCIPEFETQIPNWFDMLWAPVAGGRAMGSYSLLDLGDVARDIPYWLVYGCNYAVRRDLVTECGGFHPDALPPELLYRRGDGETGLSMQIARSGHRVRYEPSATVHHFVAAERLTVGYLRQRALAQGISDSYATIRYGRPVWRNDLTWMKLWARAAAAPEQDRRSILRAQAAGYREGLRFHRDRLKADPSLISWIRQASYFDHGTSN